MDDEKRDAPVPSGPGKESMFIRAIPTEVLDVFREQAVEQDRSIAYLIREAMAEWVERKQRREEREALVDRF